MRKMVLQNGDLGCTKVARMEFEKERTPRETRNTTHVNPTLSTSRCNFSLQPAWTTFNRPIPVVLEEIKGNASDLIKSDAGDTVRTYIRYRVLLLVFN